MSTDSSTDVPPSCETPSRWAATCFPGFALDLGPSEQPTPGRPALCSLFLAEDAPSSARQPPPTPGKAIRVLGGGVLGGTEFAKHISMIKALRSPARKKPVSFRGTPVFSNLFWPGKLPPSLCFLDNTCECWAVLLSHGACFRNCRPWSRPSPRSSEPPKRPALSFHSPVGPLIYYACIRSPVHHSFTSAGFGGQMPRRSRHRPEGLSVPQPPGRQGSYAMLTG